jgi:hypothetical protein
MIFISVQVHVYLLKNRVVNQLRSLPKPRLCLILSKWDGAWIIRSNFNHLKYLNTLIFSSHSEIYWRKTLRTFKIVSIEKLHSLSMSWLCSIFHPDPFSCWFPILTRIWRTCQDSQRNMRVDLAIFRFEIKNIDILLTFLLPGYFFYLYFFLVTQTD